VLYYQRCKTIYNQIRLGVFASASLRSAPQKTVRPDFSRAFSRNSFYNLWHPPEALGQQDVCHSGVAARRGDLSRVLRIQQLIVVPAE